MSLKRYEVVGVQPVLEHQPGEIFEASIVRDQEQFLLSIGALRIVKAEPKKSGSGKGHEPSE